MDINKAIEMGISKLAELSLSMRDTVPNHLIEGIPYEIHIRVKPTAHKSLCPMCVQPVLKGERAFRVIRGEVHTSVVYNYYHLACFMAGLYLKIINSPDWEVDNE